MKSDMLSTATKKKLVLSGISYTLSVYIIILLFGFYESTFQNSQCKERFFFFFAFLDTRKHTFGTSEVMHDE